MDWKKEIVHFLEPNYTKKYIPFRYGFFFILFLIYVFFNEISFESGKRIIYWLLAFPIELIGCSEFNCVGSLYILSIALLLIYFYLLTCIAGYILEKYEKKK